MMKKVLSILIFSLLSISLFSQEWVNCGNQNPSAPTVELLSETGKGSTVRFALGGFFKEQASTPNGMQYIINAPKMASMLEAGAPDLPLFAIPMLIDDLAEMTIEVEKAQYQDFEDVEIAPSKGNLSREIDPLSMPFRYGEAYSKNQFFPESQAQLDAPYILRDFRGQNILVYPFAYNPVGRTLRVFTELTLSMKKVGERGSNPKLSRKSSGMRMSPEAHEMYGQRFLNYKEKAAKYTFIPDEGEMLVICPPAYLNAMQPFVDWKNESGRPTTLVSLDDAGGNNPEQIKTFILSHYNNPNENLCYVLLVGDYADIMAQNVSGGASDIWFGQLEGNDNYPEVFVGRFSAESVADVENQVAKVLYYERDLNSDADWLDKGIGIGSTEGAGNGHNGGESDHQHIDYIRDTLLHYTYRDVSRHYQGVGVGTNSAMLRDNINAGASICNYCNHGSQTSWYVTNFNNSQINALTNDYKWPVIWSTACLNGQFDYYQPCFAETWMRATNNETGAPTGAIGGMFSWSTQPWQPPMTGQDEMVNILCEWRSADRFHHTLAGASLNGNMKILDMHPSDYGVTHNTWILFGDPSLMLRTANPTPLNVTCQPEVLFIGQTELRLTAQASYALATLSLNGKVICTAPIINGEGKLTFQSPENIGTAKLVVTAFNKVTEVKDIEVIPAHGPYLTYSGFVVDDGNGQADYGDTTSINLTIKNIGNENASNIQVKLSTDSPDVEILSGEANIHSLSAMEEYTITDGFQIAIDEHILDGTQADFTVTCTDDSHTWTSHFRMTLHAPAFALVEFRPVYTVNPGENGQLLVAIKNNGTSLAYNAQLQLFCSSTDLVFDQTTLSIGTISAGNVATVTAPFTTSSQLQNNSSLEVFYRFETTKDNLQGVELLNIGSVKETFETGDFSAFDWQSLGSSQWFVDGGTSHSGSYSARSGSISHANLTTLQVMMEVPEDSEISFYKKTNSEAGKDKLTFYVDSNAKGEWSGEVDWSRETFAVATGTHTFKWIYMKDSNGSFGNDCCWIDDIQFPASAVVTFLPPLSIQSIVYGNEVTLNWPEIDDAVNYIVRRDGEIIAEVSQNSFTETLGMGNYWYCITAVNAANQITQPAFIKVKVTTVGLEELSSQASVFPNPVKDLLHIDLGQPFNYAVFNTLGQLILNGESAGNVQIQCGHIPSGLYFLQIASESQVFVKKILVNQ